MRSKAFRKRETLNLVEELEEVLEGVKVDGGDALDVGEAGALGATPPPDVSHGREGTIDDWGVHVANWDLKTQILSLLLIEVEPLKRQPTHPWLWKSIVRGTRPTTERGTAWAAHPIGEVCVVPLAGRGRRWTTVAPCVGIAICSAFKGTPSLEARRQLTQPA